MAKRTQPRFFSLALEALHDPCPSRAAEKDLEKSDYMIVTVSDDPRAITLECPHCHTEVVVSFASDGFEEGRKGGRE